MVISPTDFSFVLFFGVGVAFYWLLRNNLKYQNLYLFVLSYIFYGLGNFYLVFFIFVSTFFNYCFGILIGKSQGKKQKFFLRFSVFGNLIYLGIFKYFNFFSEEIRALLTFFGLDLDPFILNIILPVGISFFTFQLISYNIDIFRGKYPAVHDFILFSTFVAFFPKIIAGPIETGSHLLPQLRNKKVMNWDTVNRALDLLLIGYFKKIVLADIISIIIAPFYQNPRVFSSLDSIAITFLYTIQIYADFSGYTEIIRGVSLFFGIDLLENFNQPYFAVNPRDFWQRWHISLTSWLREYLYFPLGGNRKGSRRTYLNILIVFILSGLWHGAGINFILWGFLHGSYQVIHRILTKTGEKLKFDLQEKSKTLKKSLIIVYWFTTLNLVNFAWIFFRTSDLNLIGVIFSRIIQFPQEIGECITSNMYVQTLILFGTIIFFLDFGQFKKKRHEIFFDTHWIIRGVVYALLITAILLFQMKAYQPFIYIGF